MHSNKNSNHTKFIFVTGGVVSSIGKGIAAASIGALLQSRGFRVNIQKLDPYINVDAGTMNPLQHGEVFVTEDGAETDLDLGHYERFLNISMRRINNVTTGQVYNSVIHQERKGAYLGSTVQVIPHITDEIKRNILDCAKGVDVFIVEVGGTVGDIESLPFLEAIRQLRHELGMFQSISLHLTLVPYIPTAGELKTKPTQHSVQKLREIGIIPDILLCRSERPLDDLIKNKIALFSNVSANCVFNSVDASSIYEVPIKLNQQGIDERICELLKLPFSKPNLSEFNKLLTLIHSTKKKVSVAIVGKYVDLIDSYKSLNEALWHSGFANQCALDLRYIDAEKIESSSVQEQIGEVDSILVMAGFGSRGAEGKIQAIQYARTRRIPFLGICFGMQLAVVEYARNVAGLHNANSTEIDSTTPFPVVHLMEEQKKEEEIQKGGTMRLGNYPCILKDGSKAASVYGASHILERHRHRYEVNNQFRELLESKGLRICGTSPNNKLVEMIEIPEHPFFLCCQFHPEFQSRPFHPHPLFKSFIEAAMREANKTMNTEGYTSKAID